MGERELDFLLCVIGMVMVIEGIPYFGFPEKMKQMMSAILEQNESTLRVMGALLMITGLIIVYIARKGIS